METHRLQAQELAQGKRQLQAELSNMQEQLSAEIAAKNEETSESNTRGAWNDLTQHSSLRYEA